MKKNAVMVDSSAEVPNLFVLGIGNFNDSIISSSGTCSFSNATVVNTLTANIFSVGGSATFSNGINLNNSLILNYFKSTSIVLNFVGRTNNNSSAS